MRGRAQRCSSFAFSSLRLTIQQSVVPDRLLVTIHPAHWAEQHHL